MRARVRGECDGGRGGRPARGGEGEGEGSVRGWGCGRCLVSLDLCERDILARLVAHYEAVVLVRIARRDEPREEHL